jgi:ATP-dependent exoDNAse (exonuclease V) alpha subunit
LLELLKEAEKYQAQLIFAGCSAQLSSVERGGLFKVFCSRYGAEELVDIQRQKMQEQRVMAKNLACGKMAVAIDQLAGLKGLKWQETRAEAIEELIKTWAVDQTKFPFSSALILAHSNAEVRMLNEMARLYRKEKGELMDTEYVCKTVYGKIIVSQGDKIEFRHNDKELGITNGMRGTLVEANEGKFTVALQGQSRKIDFDPESYTGFQLGYATTYHRSQGQTVERAYVLYSPQMSKEKFYVSLTRHVHKVSLFAARTDVSCMADLKRQAFRKDPKETTLLYTTKDELEQYKRSLERQEHIECLKESTSLLSRAKGYTLGVWNHLKTTLDERSQRSNDLRTLIVSLTFYFDQGEIKFHSKLFV